MEADHLLGSTPTRTGLRRGRAGIGNVDVGCEVPVPRRLIPMLPCLRHDASGARWRPLGIRQGCSWGEVGARRRCGRGSDRRRADPVQRQASRRGLDGCCGQTRPAGTRTSAYFAVDVTEKGQNEYSAVPAVPPPDGLVAAEGFARAQRARQGETLPIHRSSDNRASARAEFGRHFAAV